MAFGRQLQDLQQLQVLVVEEPGLLAADIADALMLRGATVIGPVETLEAAAAALEARPPDHAVLDLDLGDDICLGIADRLDAAGIPYVLTSGFGPAATPPQLRGKPRLGKPLRAEALLAMMAAA